MTNTVVAFTTLTDSAAAGQALGRDIATAWADRVPDAVIVFASPRYDQSVLLSALKQTCRPRVLIGCSSAGEFTRDAQAENAACAAALQSSDMRFGAAVGRGMSRNAAGAAQEIASTFQGLHTHQYPYRYALLLVDALAGHTEEFIESLAVETAGAYEFFGGGAGDNAQFRHTPVFCDTEVVSDAAVALEILSTKPIGIGVKHGWTPATPGMRVTEADGARLVGVNARPAVEVFEEYADATGQHFDPSDPIPFFLHNIIGTADVEGHKLRVPLAIQEDGSVLCAAEVPAGATIHIMRASSQTAADAATAATGEALRQLGQNPPGAAIFFDCVATRLRLGRDFGLELDALRQALGPIPLAGCNTHGQVARAEGQFSGFHNCTAVVCVLPE